MVVVVAAAAVSVVVVAIAVMGEVHTTEATITETTIMVQELEVQAGQMLAEGQ